MQNVVSSAGGCPFDFIAKHRAHYRFSVLLEYLRILRPACCFGEIAKGIISEERCGGGNCREAEIAAGTCHQLTGPTRLSHD